MDFDYCGKSKSADIADRDAGRPSSRAAKLAASFPHPKPLIRETL